MKYAINHQEASSPPEPKFQIQPNPRADFIAACKAIQPGQWFEWSDAPSKPQIVLGRIRTQEQVPVSAYESKDGRWIVQYDAEALAVAIAERDERKVRRAADRKSTKGYGRKLTDLHTAIPQAPTQVDKVDDEEADEDQEEEAPKLTGSEQLIFNCLNKCKRAMDASSLINDTKVQRSAVYASTSRLVELGLIVVVMIGNTRHWRIA